MLLGDPYFLSERSGSIAPNQRFVVRVTSTAPVLKSEAFSFSCIFLYVPTAHVAFQFAAPHIFPHTPASLSADFDI